jgi:23S rRNA G2445 N2-methylase RlmL
LETISARELACAPGVTVTETAYRRVEAICAGPLDALLALRTVDDIFLRVATWAEIGRPRSTLERLRALSARLDLVPALRGCATVRPIPYPPAFSLSVSFVGKRNYTTHEIKAILAERIASRHGWGYQPDDRLADVHLRVFIEHEQAHVGMRLAKQPLHERPYRQVQRAGALKPSAAAALVMAADVHAGLRVLDPCCGSGTLLIEAAAKGALVCGGDSDPAAVQATQINCRAACVCASLQHWQAEALPLAAASIDRVICNLPWGRQTQADGSLADFYQAAFAEMRRVLAPAGRIALLTTRPELIDPLELACVQRFEMSLFGQRPTMLVFS